MNRSDRQRSGALTAAIGRRSRHRLQTRLCGMLIAIPALMVAGVASAQQAPGSAPAATPGKLVFDSTTGAKYEFDADGPAGNPLALNATDQPGNISGVWLAVRIAFSSPGRGKPGAAGGPPEPRTMEGDPIPMTPWAAETYNRRRQRIAAGEPYDGTTANCLPVGMPQMAIGDVVPIQIIQSPGQVTVIEEMANSHRLISVGGKLPDDPDPSYVGTSVAQWEGQTLVVTTTGIRDNTVIGPLAGGVPHSDMLRTVERIRRLDHDTLEVIETMYDSKAYTKPWSMRGIYKLLPYSAGTPKENICENQRNPADPEGFSRSELK